jgi:hypothetical protein
LSVFKGFEDWIEIFRGGKVTDTAGVEHDGDDLIEKAIRTFNASEHEPPVVVGHPKDDAPAYAWVAGLKDAVRDGRKVMLAKFRQVAEPFADMVSQGRFKKRSAAFYPDGRLRHVGFLGAAPPAVKGLADMDFADIDDAVVFEFAEVRPWTWGAIADTFRRIRDWLIETQGREVADSVIPTWETETIDEERRRAESPDAEGDEPMEYTEADIEKIRQEEREKAEREFAEREAQKAQESARAANKAWLEGKVSDGTIPPVVAKMGVVEFMDTLAVEGEFQFTENGGKKAPAVWFKEFLTELFEGKFGALFSEFATKDRATDGADTDVIPDLTSKV